MGLKEESEKLGLKFNIKKKKKDYGTTILIEGEKMKTLTDFIFVSKITENSDHSIEIQRCLLFGRKAMTNLDSTL